jgi:hypothetical protein
MYISVYRNRFRVPLLCIIVLLAESTPATAFTVLVKIRLHRKMRLHHLSFLSRSTHEDFETYRNVTLLYAQSRSHGPGSINLADIQERTASAVQRVHELPNDFQ